jgi:hypothetical protein
MKNATPPVGRRVFFKESALLVSATVLGFGGIFGATASRAAADGDDVKTILDTAATAETFACTHYYQALKSKIRFTTPQLAYIKAALEQELIHLEYLNANGGKTGFDKFYFPQGVFKSAVSFGLVSAIAETVFVGAYLAATRRFSEMGQPLLAATAAQVAVVEGQHLALVRQTSGQLPNNIALGEPIFYNVSDAVSVVRPLLDGKEGGLGKMETETVAYPGAEAIRKAIGKSALAPVKPFTDPSVSPDTAATPGATQAATTTP